MNNKSVKILKTVLSSLWWCVLALLVVLLVNIFRAKMTGKVPSVFGYSVMNIVSGSMDPEIPQGSYILVKKTDAEKVKRGDVICFYSTDPKINGLPNTHRVVEEPIIRDGKIEFVTKGDASPANDAQNAMGERLIGVYVKRLDGLTAFTNSLTPNVLTVTIVILLISTCTIFVLGVVLTKENGECEKKQENPDGKN